MATQMFAEIAENDIEIFDTEIGDQFEEIINIDENIAGLLDEIHAHKASLNDSTISDVSDRCRWVIVDTIIGPFGLSSVLFQNDVAGGNVTTAHSFEKGIAATSSDQAKYTEWETRYGENSPGWTKSEGRKQYQSEFNKVKDTAVDRFAAAGYIDGYTGKTIEGAPEVDHVIPLKTIDQSLKARLATDADVRHQIASNPDNLVVTNKSLNASKNSHDLSEWMNDQSSGAPPGVTNADRYEVDATRAAELSSKADKSVWQEIDHQLLNKQMKELKKTGTSEGLKTALRMVTGAILFDLARLTIDEIRGAMRKLKSQDDGKKNLVSLIKAGFVNIFKKILSTYSKLLTRYFSAALTGFLTGFINSFLTFLINNLLTTAKNAVKCIREGFRSITLGIKTIVYPDSEMSKEQALLKGSDILIAGVTTILGLTLQEAIKQLIDKCPPLIPFSSEISQVMAGLVTGVSTVLILNAFHQLYSTIKIANGTLIIAGRTLLITKYSLYKELIFVDKLLLEMCHQNQIYTQYSDQIDQYRESSSQMINSIKSKLSWNDLVAVEQ